MKNIGFFDSPKYKNSNCIKVDEYVFRTENLYLTSICFQQEPDLGEGTTPANISQYPLEDILDSTGSYVHDFYEDLNINKSGICYLELASPNIESIRAVTSLFGKHVYNKSINGVVELIIEEQS